MNVGKATQRMAFATLLAIAGPALAQSAAQSAQQPLDQPPSVNSIIDQLKADKGNSVIGVHTRSLRPGAASVAMTAAAAPASISVQILFDFNSARINEASAQTMSNLATALSSDQLKGRHFDIVGHTDAKGSPGYNMRLSKLRAASVKSYLTEHGVDASRLTTEGKGMTDLLNKADPYAAENRRVVIMATGG